MSFQTLRGILPGLSCYKDNLLYMKETSEERTDGLSQWDEESHTFQAGWTCNGKYQSSQEGWLCPFLVRMSQGELHQSEGSLSWVYNNRLGGTHQILKRCMRLNPAGADWKGFSPLFFEQWDACCCWNLVWLQSSCAALEGSHCHCEKEIKALLIYTAPLRYQDD